MVYITETQKVKQKMFDVTTAFLAGAGAASCLWSSSSILFQLRGEQKLKRSQ
jgi:hypothetical protein